MRLNDLSYKYFNLFNIILISFCILLLLIQMFIMPMQGDEGFYLKEINRINSLGVYSAFVSGFSYLYLLLVLLFDFFISSPLLSLRIVALSSSIAIFLLSKNLLDFLKVDKQYQLIAMLTIAFVLTRNVEFYQGISDRLMIFLVLLGLLYYIQYYYNNRPQYVIVSGIFLGLSLWVRSFTFIFLLGFAVAFLVNFLFQNKNIFYFNLKMGILWGVTIVLIGFIPHVPSIIENQKLAFEDKGNEAWANRNWFTHIERINVNSFFVYGAIPWEELDSMIESYGGEENIPKNIKDIYIKDRKFLVDNFLVNMFRIFFLIIAGTGVIGLLFLDYLRIPEKLYKYRKEAYFQPLLSCLLIVLTVAFTLSLIIVNYIEWRWFTLPLILIVVIGVKRLQNLDTERSRTRFIVTQNIILSALLGINFFSLVKSLVFLF